MLIILPLVENVVSFYRTADGVQHITVALAVYTFLKCLDRETEINLVCGNVFTDAREVCSLDGIQKHKKA